MRESHALTLIKLFIPAAQFSRAGLACTVAAQRRCVCCGIVLLSLTKTIDMTIAEFSTAPALLGGALIGLAAVMLMAISGRVAGVSGIVGGALTPRAGDFGWRIVFVLGLIAGVAVAVGLGVVSIPAAQNQPLARLIAAGVLVGVGTALGAGCTSGHGVCGIARGSPRSIVATMVFMVTGGLVVFALRHYFA